MQAILHIVHLHFNAVHLQYLEKLLNYYITNYVTALTLYKEKLVIKTTNTVTSVNNENIYNQNIIHFLPKPYPAHNI